MYVSEWDTNTERNDLASTQYIMCDTYFFATGFDYYVNKKNNNIVLNWNIYHIANIWWKDILVDKQVFWDKLGWCIGLFSMIYSKTAEVRWNFF